MRRKTLKLVTAAACMMLGMSLCTACGDTTLSEEEASGVVSEVKEDLDDAKEDIDDAKDELKNAKEEVKEDIEKAKEE